MKVIKRDGRVVDYNKDKILIAIEKANNEVIDEKGPAHDKTFTCQVKVDDVVMGKGTGTSKKNAEQAAAKVALSKQVKI